MRMEGGPRREGRRNEGLLPLIPLLMSHSNLLPCSSPSDFANPLLELLLNPTSHALRRCAQVPVTVEQLVERERIEYVDKVVIREVPIEQIIEVQS